MMDRDEALIARERRKFHATLLGSILTTHKGCPSIADTSSKPSIQIAQGVLERLGVSEDAPKLPGQSAGSRFEGVCVAFLQQTFTRLGHLRPGNWLIGQVKGGIDQFVQYAHLHDLERLAKKSPELAAVLGNDYTIKPDVVVARKPEPDEVINQAEALVDPKFAVHSVLREAVNQHPILHASISCKWTLRSDRAQNARTEGLNLLRNRKGRVPHIVVITAEPLPGRLASLALGTGDIDCVYHFALPELQETLIDQQREDAQELLETMIEGKRIKDISDLPFDLAV